MGRPLRTVHEGGWHFVTARANSGLDLFRDTEDYGHLISNLSQLHERHQVRLAAFVLLPDHYHLLAHFPVTNLSRAMQWLNVSYGHWHQHRHHFRGHLFSGRFDSMPLAANGPGPLLASQYIHLHPIRHKLGLRGPGEPWLPAQRGTCFHTATDILYKHQWNSAIDWLHGPRPWLRPLDIDAYPDRLHDTHQRGIKPGPKSLKSHQPNTPSPYIDPNTPTNARAIVERIKAGIAHARKQPWESFASKHGDKGRDHALAQAHTQGLSHKSLGFLFEMSIAAVAKAIHRYHASSLVNTAEPISKAPGNKRPSTKSKP